MHKCKILICFSKTGKGHQSAAIAIADAISEIYTDSKDKPTVLIEDVLTNSCAINYFFVSIYNFILRHCQPLMKHYYRYLEWTKPNLSSICYRFSENYIKSLLKQTQPCVIVSTHPMINQYLARAISELNLQSKFIVVLTDPSNQFWTAWACNDASLTIVPNDLACQRLITLGVKPTLLKIIGMPVHPQFTQPAKHERRALLNELGLETERTTILILGSAEGGESVKQIYTALKSINSVVQVVYVGGSESARAKITRESIRQNIKTAILPFSSEMADLMNACDLIVTKAGGLTIFESIARHLPIALNLMTDPMPQEIGTVEMLLDVGLARPVRKAEDIVEIALQIARDGSKSFGELPGIHNLNNTCAVYEIAQEIISCCNKQAACLSAKN